jgi:hypothetical protein
MVTTATYTPAIEEDVADIGAATYTHAIESDFAREQAGIQGGPAVEYDIAPPLYRRGAALPQLIVMCGCGYQDVSGAAKSYKDETTGYETVTKEFIPMYAGIAVQPDRLYGFSIWLRVMSAQFAFAGIMWFEAPGKIVDQIGVKESDPWAPEHDDWDLFTVQQTPPEGAAFLIPYVRLTNTFADIPFYMAGAMVYVHGDSGVVAAFAPDRYLTLSGPGEVIGADEDEGGGFVIGDPTQRKRQS